MKRIILSLALALTTAGYASAQQQNPGSWKAYDKIQKADKAMESRSEEGLAQAKALYQEADDIIKADIETYKAKGDVEKLALLYTQNAELKTKVMAPIMNQAAGGMPFDTIAFCNYVDEVISSYNTSATYNTTPNAKGKVKENKIVTAKTKFGIMNNMTLYYNCGAFMDAIGDKQKSIDYFQKFIDLPKQSPVFTAHEADSICNSAKMKPIYDRTRFNLALLNYNLKNWDKAVAAADEALKVDTVANDVHDLCLIKINALGEKKDSVAWQEALIEASQLTGSSSFLQNLLYYYMLSGKTDDAVALANKLVTERPNDKTAWYMKGAIELNILEEYEGCRTSFQKALDIDPDFKDALNNMGVSYINDIYSQRVSGKFKYIGTNRAITGKTSDGTYQKNKAIYEKELATVKSYYEKALPYFEHLRELTPDQPKVWANSLEQVYTNLGEKEKAQEMADLLKAAYGN